MAANANMNIANELNSNSTVPDLRVLPSRYGWPVENERGYRITEKLYGAERPLRVISLGAGVSGINLAKMLPETLKNASLTIYEKNPDVGGTWYENRYPGVACDIPSNSYQFTWAKNPEWSTYYSYGHEILQYVQNVAERFNLKKYFVFNHIVTGAYWDEDRGVWDVKIKNMLTGAEFMDSGEIFINNCGLLNHWKWPQIEGLHGFKGQLCHTAKYDPKTDLDNKRVAVIGTGSSGVQVIPTIVSKVKELHTWIRTPTWITPGFAQKYAGPNGQNFAYTADQKKQWQENPLEYQEYCKNIEKEMNQRFKFILKGSPDAEQAKTYSIDQMKTKLGSRKDIMERIIPTNFGVGCRRPTPGNGFLEALTEPHVTVYNKMLQKVSERGFVDSEGVEHEIDVIICATGFDTSWVPRFPIVARGLNIQDLHKEKLQSYLSLGVPDIPNYYTICGPYGPLGHGSYIPVTELLVKNILKVIAKMQKEDIKSMTPRRDVCEAFAEHADLYVKRTAWSDPCSSWFKNGDPNGRLTMFPGSRLTYFDLLEDPRYEDYKIGYWSSNQFNFLGNGFSTIEFDGSDISHYLGPLAQPVQLLPPGDNALGQEKEAAAII